MVFRIVALLLLLAGSAVAQPLRIGPEDVGPPGSGATAVLHLPPGPGPHPAVLLLHGCSGVTPTVRRWAARLAEWGYAALVLDSFRARGVTNVCRTRGTIPAMPGLPDPSPVTPAMRAGDAFAAADLLRARPDIRPDRVSLVGFSHGGTTALVAASRTAVERLGARPFRRVVAFYPWCPRAGAPLASPVLTLIGDADEWTPAERCRFLQANWRAEFGEATLHVYPGATHAFDSRGPERVYMGYTLRHDPAATEDAAERLRRFLGAD